MTLVRALLVTLVTVALGAAVTAVFGWGWWSIAVIGAVAVVGARWAVPGES
jgi:hypothetical protein